MPQHCLSLKRKEKRWKLVKVLLAIARTALNRFIGTFAQKKIMMLEAEMIIGILHDITSRQT